MAAPDATAYQMHVGPENTGLLKVRQNDETAKKVTELLQRDLKVSVVGRPRGNIDFANASGTGASRLLQ